MITSAVSSANSTWAVSFMIRSHGLPLRQAGAILALTVGCVGALGIASSGWIIDRLGRRDVRWRTWYCAIVQIIGLPAFLLFLLAPTVPLALTGLAIWSICQGSLYGPVVSLCQNLVGPRMRGSVMAIFYIVSNFVGFGLGPQVVGIVSDLLRPTVGAESLRYALLCLSASFIFAALLLYRASRTLERDLARADPAS